MYRSRIILLRLVPVGLGGKSAKSKIFLNLGIVMANGGNLVPVPWYPVIWNRLNLPKHSIIGWLAIQCRLLTKDRLLRFNIISDGYCDMCLDHLEDHTHLLYRCRFSVCCWRLLADWLDINLPDTDILNWCIRWRCRSLMKKQIVITAIMAMIYQIWNARNICRVDN
ncbi:uncharacterized protein LOC141628891 [Silene latifolia]|uniref:uncharacterized protein LOC141628891 n=1 Tax=Silene latifolia TaxID=37657 RepID=UPI003D77167E